MTHIALTIAGLIGAATAIFHGILTQRLMVRPIERRLADAPGISATVRRIVPPLLHYSTYSWLVGGLALVVAANRSSEGATVATALLVGSMFAYAAAANLWATRGRHPGWMLMAAAVGLIAFDLAF